MIKISKGLDIPITGNPEQKIYDGPRPSTVAVMGQDYIGLRPTILVQVGDKVKKGQKLLEDKKNPGVFVTAPVAGSVRAINRGEKRAFESIELTYEGEEQVSFSHFQTKTLSSWKEGEIRNLLQESGLWCALRRRPFSKVPGIEAKASALFINVMDTHPLAADPKVVMASQLNDFNSGVEILSKLTPKTYVITHEGAALNLSLQGPIIQESFSGPHPAGLVGTHIHHLHPVSASKEVWHLSYQDVMAVGKLFSKGELSCSRVISLAGPAVKKPRLLKTLWGASLKDLTQGELVEGQENRLISGSVLGGRTAHGTSCYLGRYHLQVSVVKEGREREFLGWHRPGLNKFSLKNIFVSKLMPGKKFAFTTNVNGSHRSIVPIGSYEAVFPGDFLPTYLLRYLLAKHSDRVVELGGLELDEEDLALCSFVDPCKNEFGPILRENLSIIEKEG